VVTLEAGVGNSETVRDTEDTSPGNVPDWPAWGKMAYSMPGGSVMSGTGPDPLALFSKWASSAVGSKEARGGGENSALGG
jgi:hypothetical protein